MYNVSGKLFQKNYLQKNLNVLYGGTCLLQITIYFTKLLPIVLAHSYSMPYQSKSKPNIYKCAICSKTKPKGFAQIAKTAKDTRKRRKTHIKNERLQHFIVVHD